MSESKETPVRYLGTYYDRDTVLTVARWAQILSWVGAAIYLVTWVGSSGQFAIQFATGMFYNKGMTIFDTLNFFSPYLLQPLPGVLYFFSLQGIARALQIFMDIEDNSRRTARGQ